MYGRGNYMPHVRMIYWCMRGDGLRRQLVPRRRSSARSCYWKRRLERARWFLWIGARRDRVPVLAAITAGWMLTEIGRQPWIVQGLLKTADANSPAVSLDDARLQPRPCSSASTLLLLVLDIWLMRALREDRPAGARRGTRRQRPRCRRSATESGSPGALVLPRRLLLRRLLPARGLRLRRRDAAAVPAARRAGAQRDVPLDRAGLGRQRGVARRRGRRDVRGVPGLVRDDVLRLLHRAAAAARLPDRPRDLVRVAREERELALARPCGRGRTRSAASARR